MVFGLVDTATAWALGTQPVSTHQQKQPATFVNKSAKGKYSTNIQIYSDFCVAIGTYSIGSTHEFDCMFLFDIVALNA